MATPPSKLDIRNAIRARLSAWPEDVVPLGGALNSGATTLTLATAAAVPERALLQIDSEIIRVRAGAGDAVTVMGSVLRGDRGSVAAAHLDQAPVTIFPFWGWTDQDINNEIDRAIDWLYPEYWILQTLTNTFAAGQTDFGLPAGCVYPQGNLVKRVELLDPSIPVGSNGPVYKEILGWKHVGDRLILERWTRAAYTARIWVQMAQPRLVQDSDQLQANDPLEAIVYYATSNLLEQMLSQRTRYVEYAASLNDRASSPDELQRNAYYFKNQAVVARDRIMRPALSGMASTRRSG